METNNPEESLHKTRKEEQDAAQQCLKVIMVCTLLNSFTITAASGAAPHKKKRIHKTLKVPRMEAELYGAV